MVTVATVLLHYCNKILENKFVSTFKLPTFLPAQKDEQQQVIKVHCEIPVCVTTTPVE